MSANRTPGRVCQFSSPATIDDGTLCRIESTIPAIGGQGSGWSNRTCMPAGRHESVIMAAAAFVAAHEFPKGHYSPYPYLPQHGKKGGQTHNDPMSGITIGFGYDIHQHSERDLRSVWKALAPKDLDALATVIHVTGADADAQAQLNKVKSIEIRDDVASSALSHVTVNYYDRACHSLPGFAQLPQPVQVALISIGFNRGFGMRDPKPKGKAGDSPAHTRLEMREIRSAVEIYAANQSVYALKAIYDAILSMTRLWVGKGLNGLISRRIEEAALVAKCLPPQLAETPRNLAGDTQTALELARRNAPVRPIVGR